MAGRIHVPAEAAAAVRVPDAADRVAVVIRVSPVPTRLGTETQAEEACVKKGTWFITMLPRCPSETVTSGLPTVRRSSDKFSSTLW